MGTKPLKPPKEGDANLDSDRNGPGERAAAGRDIEADEAADIDTEHVELAPEDLGMGDEEEED